MKEVWSVDTSRRVVYHQDIIANPSAFGDLSVLRKVSIANGEINIPLKLGCITLNTLVSENDARRIISDGGVDIYSEGNWCRISTVDVMFKDTDEKITIL